MQNDLRVGHTISFSVFLWTIKCRRDIFDLTLGNWTQYYSEFLLAKVLVVFCYLTPRFLVLVFVSPSGSASRFKGLQLHTFRFYCTISSSLDTKLDT